MSQIMLMTKSAICSLKSCFPTSVEDYHGSVRLTDKYANSLAKAFAKNLGYSMVVKVWQNSGGAFAEVK